MEETITITCKEYKQLKKDELLLDCLRGAGVDNWSGWDDAIDMYEEAQKEDE